MSLDKDPCDHPWFRAVGIAALVAALLLTLIATQL